MITTREFEPCLFLVIKTNDLASPSIHMNTIAEREDGVRVQRMTLVEAALARVKTVLTKIIVSATPKGPETFIAMISMPYCNMTLAKHRKKIVCG